MNNILFYHKNILNNYLDIQQLIPITSKYNNLPIICGLQLALQLQIMQNIRTQTFE